MTDSSKKMREYETIYIMRAELDDKLAKEFMLSTKELVERLGGKNLKVTAMGRKRLAWERKKEQRGIYVMHSYLANPGMVGDFERALSIDDKILLRQSMLIKTGVDPETANVEEDQLVPPVFKERREMGQRGHYGSYDRGDRSEGRSGPPRSYGNDDRDFNSDNYRKEE